MIPALATFLFLAALILTGRAIVSLVFGGRQIPFAQLTGLTLATGAGALSYLLFVLAIAGIRPGWAAVSGVALVSAMVCIQLWRRQQCCTALRNESSGTDWLSIGLFVCAGVFIFLPSLVAYAFPFYDWDSFTIYALKAKVIVAEGLSPRPEYFNDPTVSFSHLDYPLMVPMLIAVPFALCGTFNEVAGMAIFPVIIVAFGLLIYSALRWKLERLHAAALTALTLSLPTVVRWVTTGTADLALAMFHMGSVFYLVKWIDGRQRTDLVWLIVFSVFGALTKNEGLTLAIINGVVILRFAIAKRDKSLWIGLLIFGLGCALLYLPWWLWSHDIPKIFENYGARLRPGNVMENVGRLSLILPEFFRRIWALEPWGIFWLLLMALAVLGFRGFRMDVIRALWLLLALHVALYVVVFVVTPWNVIQLMDSILDRILLHTVPAAVLLIGYHWEALIKSRAPNEKNPAS